MKIAINAVSAKRGGSVTYLQNMLPVLREKLGGVERDQVVVWRPEGQTADARWPAGIEYRQDAAATGGVGAVGSTLGRLWFDQVSLPRTLRSEGFDVLFSSANFGPLRVGSRHVLLVRNAAYFDSVYLGRVRAARVLAYYTLQRLLTLRCIETADAVLFPTFAMRDLVASHTGSVGSNWSVAPYGTRHDLFRSNGGRPLAQRKHVELLNVSLYCDQKNLGTLMGAVELLQAETPERFRLTLTAGFGQDWMSNDPYFPRFVEERTVYQRLHERGVVRDADWSRYGSLPALYHSSDIFVFPSYTESFGHPLVEAMAAGLAIVAADVPSSRELCGDAAVYFSPFDVRACADALRKVADSPVLAGELRAKAIARAAEFTWERHVSELTRAMGMASS
jgi:glycosyltransferase involved in cell wall biosynthesis